MNWCKIGIHEYSKWKVIRSGSWSIRGHRQGCYMEQQKVCKQCGKVKLRMEYS